MNTKQKEIELLDNIGLAQFYKKLPNGKEAVCLTKEGLYEVLEKINEIIDRLNTL